MLNVKQMDHIFITGHKNILEQTIKVLHNSNLFQIEDFVEDGSGLKIGKPIGNIDSVSKQLIKIRSIASFLGIKDKDINKQNIDYLNNDLDSTLSLLEEEVSSKTEQKSIIENKIKDLENLKRDISPFSNINLDIDDYSGYDNLTVFTGTLRTDIDSEISKITSSYKLYTDSKNGTIVLFVPNMYKEEISKLLSEHNFKELRTPNTHGTPAALLSDIEFQKSSLEKELISMENDIESLKNKYAEFILASNEMLSIETEKSEAPLRIATTENTFLLEGWIPSESYDTLNKKVLEATDGHVYISKEEITHEDEAKVPIEYDNPKVVKPLEEIMTLYSRPSYREIDPSSIIFITFPLLYGMILGDIGYALFLFTISMLLKKFLKSEGIKPILTILIYCQIFTFIFGILYGEIFGFPLASYTTHHGGETVVTPGLIPGFETINLFPSPVGGEIVTFPLHRTHMVMTFIVATALIGFLHFNFGYILGFINENSKHGFTAALFEKGSWIIVEIGLILAALGYMNIIPSIATYIGIIVFLVGLIMLYKGEGIKGPIELPSILSNSLSYTRLIAVGLSSIYIASTVNRIAFGMIWSDHSQFGITTVFAIIVFIFGHSLNSVLSIIAPGLHSLRLQYVEFFGKFYQGGGREYEPFGYVRNYTEE